MNDNTQHSVHHSLRDDYPADNPVTRLAAAKTPEERELIRNGVQPGFDMSTFYDREQDKLVDDEGLHDERVKRYAVVRANNQREVEAYLPDNYRVVSAHAAEPVVGGRVNIVIEGLDYQGWTLDGYVLPRLYSGNLPGREYPSWHDAEDAACASMN